MFAWFSKQSNYDRRLNDIIMYLKTAKKTVAFTGAGISTASGIPDFRSPSSGIWDNLDPTVFTSWAFAKHPEQFYQACLSLVPEMRAARPTAIHYLLANLEKQGLIAAVITQNIDALHQKAGSRNVYEIHGNVERALCTQCHRMTTTALVLQQLETGTNPPLCTFCQGILKIDVVLFGDQMPADFDRAMKFVADADLFLILGTSLSVEPANLIPTRALRGFARMVIVNRVKTPYDHRADFVIHDDLENFAAKLQAHLDADR